MEKKKSTPRQPPSMGASTVALESVAKTAPIDQATLSMPLATASRLPVNQTALTLGTTLGMMAAMKPKRNM